MNILTQLKKNWKSGISVAMVSIPLSLSLAIAAGAPPMSGIITAAWAGLIGGIIGGSQFNIIGPAGALTGILIGYSIIYSPAILPFLAIGAGIIILIAWALEWDKYLIFVPSSVIHGFTLGVALNIGFSQLNSALGILGLPAHESVIANITESFRHIYLINWAAFISFIVGLLLLFIIIKYKPLWPNSIIVAILGILAGYSSTHGLLPWHFETIGSKFHDLSSNLFLFPSVSALLSNQSFSELSHFSQFIKIFSFSAVIAFVALLETLISAKTADGMTKTKFNQRRETMSLGFANIASGFFGGLPASGVFARTALNVKSGAVSHYSQIINAVAVGLISVIFISGFSYLPLSITASILVYAAIRMVTAEHFRKIFKFDRSTFILSMVVAGLTFGIDATTGILVGTVASLLLFANQLSQTQLASETDPEIFNPEDYTEKAVVYRFAGALTYFNSRNHIERINLITSTAKPIILNFRHLHYKDIDGHEALDEIVELIEERGQTLFVVRIKPEMLHHFRGHAWFNRLEGKGRVLHSTDEALEMID